MRLICCTEENAVVMGEISLGIPQRPSSVILKLLRLKVLLWLPCVYIYAVNSINNSPNVLVKMLNDFNILPPTILTDNSSLVG